MDRRVGGHRTRLFSEGMEAADFTPAQWGWAPVAILSPEPPNADAL